MDFSLALGLASGARAVAGEDRYDDDDDYEDPLAYSSAYSSPAYRPPRRRRGAPSEDEDDDQDDDDDDDDDDDSEAVHSDSSLSYSQYASANPSPEKGLVTTVQQRSDGKLARALALLTRGAYQHYSMEAAAADTVDSVHSLRAANEKLWNELKSTEAQRAALEDENRAMRTKLRRVAARAVIACQQHRIEKVSFKRWTVFVRRHKRRETEERFSDARDSIIIKHYAHRRRAETKDSSSP